MGNLKSKETIKVNDKVLYEKIIGIVKKVFTKENKVFLSLVSEEDDNLICTVEAKECDVFLQVEENKNLAMLKNFKNKQCTSIDFNHKVMEEDIYHGCAGYETEDVFETITDEKLIKKICDFTIKLLKEQK